MFLRNELKVHVTYHNIRAITFYDTFMALTH